MLARVLHFRPRIKAALPIINPAILFDGFSTQHELPTGQWSSPLVEGSLRSRCLRPKRVLEIGNFANWARSSEKNELPKALHELAQT